MVKQTAANVTGGSANGPTTAARAILDDLADVLREAGARGVDLGSCFQHFDRRGGGLVDVDVFMAALAELRLGSGGDFLRFFGEQQKRPSSSIAIAKSRNAAARGKKPKAVEDNNSYSTTHVDYVDAFRRAQQASLSGVARVGITARPKKHKPVKPSLLPAWARDRSKRALQELEGLQQRKRRLPPSVSTRLFYHDERQRQDAEGEGEHHVADSAEHAASDQQTAPGVSKLRLSDSTVNQDELLEFPTDPRWRSFELDVSTSIAYAVLSHDTATSKSSVATNPMSSSPKRPLASAKYADFEVESDSGLPNLTAFRFTVVLDAFQQLETLDEFFQPLLVHFPRGKVLVCGFPTRTPRTALWNNDGLAQAYAKLLVHVMRTTREWLVQPKLGVGAVPQFVVAFGTGASAALRLLTVEIPRRMPTQPQLQLFLRAQRGLVLVNALAQTSGGARHSLQQLKRALSSVKNRAEVHEALVQSVFSEFYLTQVASSRRAATEAFFKTRKRFLEGPNLELLRLLLHGSIKNKSVDSALSNLRAAEHPFSLVLVHGSLNALFGADQVKLVTAAFPAECAAPSLSACLAAAADSASTPQVHVSWLKSGHEVLQERPRFMHELFRQLVLISVDAAATPSPQVHRSSAGAAELEETQQPAQSTPSDRPAPDSQGQATDRTDTTRAPPDYAADANDATPDQSPQAPERQHSPSDPEDCSKLARELLTLNGIKWVQQELFDRGLEGSGASAVLLERFRQALEAEHAHARNKQAREAAQRARLDARKALARERQREELERQVREKEVETRIKQREHDAQRAFFAQMEAQKLAHARVALELELMALEDVFSQRQEGLESQEAEREDRNTEMALKVEEIDAERLEQERERHQVALQQERLAAQLEKREQLKRFQKAFEQDELVSSPVEAYALDLLPKYDNFRALAGGARALTRDLVHFYELKASQKAESAEKRAGLNELQKAAAVKELAVRNLERVVLKAKATGMIAKAGLGTVRIVPVTTQEFQALARELDEKQDELVRVHHDVALRLQELAWKDTLLQRLSELIKRNEGFRAEMLRTLYVCVETGNERVLCAREEGEKLFGLRERNARLEKRCASRLQAVQAERDRAKNAATEYFDTSLRIEGAAQRVVRTVLVREHDAEVDVLEKKVAELRGAETDVQAKLRNNKRELHELGEQTFNVEQSLRALEQAIAARDRLSDSSERTKAGVGESCDSGGGRPLRPELAEEIRRKPHASRSAEEKQWVALDFRVNFAHYYKRIDPAEVEIIQKHADYQQQQQQHQQQKHGIRPDRQPLRLDKQQIERLLALPARGCLALAFFKTAEELEAHSLLRKFTCGDGEAYFASHDDAFALDSVKRTGAIVTTTLKELPDAVDTASTRASAAGVIVDRGRCALLNESAAPVTLLHAAQCELQPHRSATHSFRLPALGVGVLALTVSIVFQGHFRSTGYQNGRLAGMLYVLPPTPADSAQVPRAPVPIGKCFHERDIALCSPRGLGKLVLRHEPTHKPLCAGATYQVVLGAPVFTAYSLEVTAATALLASEALTTKRADALKKQELLPLRKDEIQNVFVSIQLSERKKRLARAMANSARDAARAAELEMLRATTQLDADNAAPALGPEPRAQLHAAARAAEAAFTHQCFLYAKREEEARDIEAGLQELTRIHADLLQQCDAMERDLVAYRAHLPRLAAVLVESSDARDRDAAGAKYVGAKSGKVLWAELSAMKATLPSMMTPAERLRRKYKKGQDALEKKEREWVLLDRILHPRAYDWEARLVVAGDTRMRLHGACPTLTKDEEQLAVLSRMELDRILKAPWNLLARREIQVRKILTKFRDDHGSERPSAAKTAGGAQPTTVVALLRSQKLAELTSEEREWRLYDQLLNPSYYPLNLRKLADELRHAVPTPGATAQLPNLTREDLVVALNTPEEELFKLASDRLRARSLLLQFDPQLSVNLAEAARIQHSQTAAVAVVETDVDARCRLVYQELQRAVANTRNEFMDSFVLHSTLQRFPTKVLRLELEKELDRLLMAQVTEKEAFELRHFLAGGTAQSKRGAAPSAGEPDADDSVSDSDSDDEAQLAREAKARRHATLDAKAGKNAKVRGKALKHKSLQKQRREIKDALRGRSLDERRLLLQEQELGVGGCLACRTNPCAWLPYLQEANVAAERRVEVLQAELERVKRCPDLTLASAVCLAAVKAGAGAVSLRKADLFDELTAELKSWDRHLRLRAVDAEFHATFRTREPLFETKALHGFAQTQRRDKVQLALAREQNRLVAHVTAHEVVDDILDAMLEGWVFGERESARQALGYVPSLKRDGPLSLHDLRVLDERARLLAAQRERAAETEEEAAQGVPLTKWRPIEVQALASAERRKAVVQGSAVDKALTETETALKFGLFCMTLMYFRGLSMLKTQRRVWAAPTAAWPSPPSQQQSVERQRMDQERRNVARRQQKAAHFDCKAQGAQARQCQFLAHKTAAYRQRLVREHQTAKREVRAALLIQRVYRGRLGRLAGCKWMRRRREIDAERALERAAATTLQRAYRGRLGRLAAEAKRVELAEFIAQVRAEEAIVEEEEYWRRHRLERAARRVAAFVKREA
ncbi:hypothetical protein PybrP1_005197 [[Pythium] brassicae (nom. inval.)]|nr:hypothetical protein PybrP1_005197 [[Pythium] brassicae (nom. inval.)]